MSPASRAVNRLRELYSSVFHRMRRHEARLANPLAGRVHFQSVEQLEPRLLLSATLPGMHLVDPTVDRFDGQIIHLDYDGADDVDYNGPVTVENIDVPAFAAPGNLAGQEQAIIADVLTRLDSTFADTGLAFVIEEPVEGSQYSTIYVGGNDAPFAAYGSFLGLAEKVDVGNSDPSDEGLVFSHEIVPTATSEAVYASHLSDVISHEVGHLLGYAHTRDSLGAGILGSVADSYDATSSKATWTYATLPNNNFGSASEIWAGRGDDGNPIYGWVEFDLSSVPEAATINSATLNLRASGLAGNATRIHARIASASWSESGLKWSNQSEPYSTPYNDTLVSGSGWYEWDVTAHVAQWISGTRPNYGFCLKSLNTDGTQPNDFVMFNSDDSSYRPYLEVTYTPVAAPEVTIEATDNSTTEPNNDGTYRITRSGSTDQGVTVNFSMSGTATRGTDYVLKNGSTPIGGDSITIEAGHSYIDITLDTLEDPEPEGTETARMDIDSGTGYDVGSPDNATISIADNDVALPTVTISAPDASAGEPSNDGTFRISRSGSTASSLTINFDSSGGDALRGTDYVLRKNGTVVSGTAVTIDAGQSYVDVTLDVTDDPDPESTEAAVLALSVGPDYVIGSPSSQTINITDDDTADGNTEYYAVLVGSGAWSYNRNANHESIVANDVADLVDTLTTYGANWAQGDIDTLVNAETSQLTVFNSIDVIGDQMDGDDVLLFFYSGHGSTTGLSLFNDDTITPFELETQFDSAIPNGAERIVLLDSCHSGLFCDYYASISSTDTAVVSACQTDQNADFYQFIFIDTGNSLFTYHVMQAISGKGDSDGDREVSVTELYDYANWRTIVGSVGFSDPDVYPAGATSNLAITQETVPGPVIAEVTAIQPSASEPSTDGLVRFSRTGPTAASLSVNFTVMGSADRDVDYRLRVGGTTLSGDSVSIPAGQSYLDVAVEVLDDALTEPTEQVTISVASGAGYSVGASDQAEVSIEDDGDQPNDPNDQISEAQMVSVGNTINGNISPDATDVDMYGFTVNPGQAVAFDIDRPSGSLDSYLRLFSSAGAELRDSDDSAGPAPEYTNLESYIEYTFSSGGTYYIGVSCFNNGSYDPITGEGDAGGSSTGEYSLILSEIVPEVSLAVSPSSVNEDGSTNLVYTFSRSVASASPLTVSFNVGGTGTYNTDYTVSGADSFNSSSGTVTILANQTTAQVTVNPTADSTVEPDETVNLTVASGSGYTVGTPSAVTGTILNDEVTFDPHLEITRLRFGDGSPLSYGWLTLHIEPEPTKAIDDVYLDLPDSTTLGMDLVWSDLGLGLGESVSADEEDILGPGQHSLSTLEGAFPTGDYILEVTYADSTSESLSFTRISGAYPEWPTVTNPEDQGDDVVLPLEFQWQAGLNDWYQISRADTGEEVSFGVFGEDIVDDGSYTIPSGILLPGDSYVLTLDRNEWGQTFKGSASLVRFDVADEVVPEVTVAVSPPSVNEDDSTNLVYTFSRSVASSSPLTVSFNVGGDATYDTDYTVTGAESFDGSSGTVTILANQTTAQVTVNPTADSTVELDETVNLTVASGSGYTVGTPSAATGTILNDDTTDPDDQISEAQMVSVGNTINGDIAPDETDVDMYGFTVNPGQTVGFDIDRPIGSLDSYLRLFSSAGAELGDSDDTPGPAPEYTSLESYIEYTFTSGGTYYIGVSCYNNSYYDPITGDGDTGGFSTGEYSLILGEIVDAEVVGRHTFYNHSYLDGNSPSANVNDDAAIALGKQALLPGNTASGANSTSYFKGINGLMIDIEELANPAGLSAADFNFRMGDWSDIAAMAPAPLPINDIAADIRSGDGVNDSDRITLIWENNAIQDTWLEVTVLATANTGLAEAVTFYWGNVRGDANGDFQADSTDIDATYAAFATQDSNADLNASGSVDQTDVDLLLQDVFNTTYADTDLNGSVDPVDLATVGLNWSPGSTVATWSEGDFTGDGAVGPEDLALVGLNWNPQTVEPTVWVVPLGLDTIYETHLQEYDDWFEIHRSGPTDQPLTISLGTSGSAEPDSDYDIQGATGVYEYEVFIPAGSTSSDPVRIAAMVDYWFEEDETVVAEIDEDPTYVLGSMTTLTLTIYDSETANVTIDATDSYASGADDTGTFVIYKQEIEPCNISVPFEMSGTAVRGIDYELWLDGELLAGDQVFIEAYYWSETIELIPYPTGSGTATMILYNYGSIFYRLGDPSEATILVEHSQDVLTEDILSAELDGGLTT